MFRCVASTMSMAALLVTLLSSGNARADSFFDIFVDLWDSGAIEMSPVDSAAFPFPPPPLDFPDVGTAGMIDIEMVSLSLRSVGPMIVNPPEPTGQFTVDSFFDIEYQINATNGNDPPSHVIDSFFDVQYSMEVTPDRTVVLPSGDEQRTFDIELVALNLTSSQPIDLTGEPDFNLAIQLQEGFPAGSDGHVTVLKLAGGGNEFQVDSFFDVFVELSIDGGSPIPSTQNSQVRLFSSVPEPSTCVMFALGLAAAIVAFYRSTR